MFELGTLAVGEEFTYEDTGFGGSGRVDTYWGIVIGITNEDLTAVRYGKKIVQGNGVVFVDDGQVMPRTGLWHRLLKVKKPLRVV